MKKNGIAFTSFILNLVLVTLVLYQGNRLNILRQDIRNVQNNLGDSLNKTMEEVSDLWEDIQAGERLISDCALEPAGLDPETRAVLLNTSVTLKEWSADTDAMLLLELDGQTTEAPLTHAGNGVFTGAAAVPVEGNGSLTVTLLADINGVVNREQADYVYPLSALLPIADRATGRHGMFWDGKALQLRSGYMFAAYDREYNNIPVQQPMFRLYRNDAVIFEEAAVESPWSSGLPHCYYLREVNEDGRGETIPVNAQLGDALRLTFVCQDQFGLAYEFTMERWKVLDGDVEEEEVYLDEDMLPALTWPE